MPTASWLSGLLQRAIATVEHDLRILRQDLDREVDEQSGRRGGNKRALAKRIDRLEDALGRLRWDQGQVERGEMRMPRERHGPSWWCWHVVLEAGTLLLGLESLICKDKKRHECVCI